MLIALCIQVSLDSKQYTSSRYPANDPDQEAIERMASMLSELKMSVPNSFGVQISHYDNPQEVIAQVSEFERYVRSLPNEDLKKISLVQDFYLEAFKILYKGRGNTEPRDGLGWFIGNRGDNGLDELDELLDMNVFDQKGKEELKAYVAGYKFDEASNRTAVGFPPAFDAYGSDEAGIRMVSGKVDDLVAVPDYEPFKAPGTGGLEDLVEKTIKDPQLKDYLMKMLVNAVERNIYDESMATMEDPAKEFVNYFGREKEFTKILEALNRTEKSHIILTGKAGVGKTTVFQMLQDKFVQGESSIRGTQSPIILELDITDVTNQQDPTIIKARIDAAKKLSKELDRHVILYVDEAHITSKMTRNAIKSFLTDKTFDDSKVHMAFSTTSSESRSFMDDVAFNRRFVEVHVEEFTPEQSVDAVKAAHLPRWKKAHKGFEGIDDDAFAFASRHYKLEQPHAGNPTGIKEFLEGAITHKVVKNQLSGESEGFTLGIDDLREYLKSNLDVQLVPGDPEFADKFENLWKKLDEDYVGQPALKAELKKELMAFFSTMDPDKVPTWVMHGPPGVGKTYLSEVIAETFFKGAVLKINSVEYSEGGLSLNKLIGSPTGTVGSEEQRSIIAKFLKDNPQGGVMVFEEADYLHSDVLKMLANAITDKKFVDGLGNEYDLSRFVIQMNTNIGQDFLVPTDAGQAMNWDQYNIRRAGLVHTKVVDGESMEVVRPEKKKEAFESFIRKIVEKSTSGEKGGAAGQEAQKQKRRMKPFYVIGPTREELEASAKSALSKFQASMALDYGVQIEIDDANLEKILNLDNFEFEKGHDYVKEQLEDKLFQFVRQFQHSKGEVVRITVQEEMVDVNGRMLPSQDIIMNIGGEEKKFSLGVSEPADANQWANSKSMRKRIKRFTSGMSNHIVGMEEQIQDTKELLKLKLTDWRTRVVLTMLGTTGNGKTEYFKGMAKTLYDDDKAFFKIEGLTNKYSLANYLRPPKGIKGATEETEFERWFKARQNAGGGIILFDELLSFQGLSRESLGEKIEVINQLYELFDEGFVDIGGKRQDARAFVIGITGNSLKELFEGIDDSPEAEKLVKKIVQSTSFEDISRYFGQIGIGEEKVMRFGRIYINGPLSGENVQMIARMKVQQYVDELAARLGRELEIDIDDKLVVRIAEDLTTVTGGMRNVDQGYQDILRSPIAGILSDIDPEERVKKLEAQLDGDKISWKVNGKEVVLEGIPIKGKNLEERNWEFKADMDDDGFDRTPQLDVLRRARVIELSEAEKAVVASHEYKGHWMVSTILRGRNNSEFISILPTQTALGYVRPKMNRGALESLTTILTNIIELQAGHRAPFKEGIYAVGGGSIYNDKGPPRDDLGKINQEIDKILKNHLLSGANSESHPTAQKALREMIMQITKDIADEIIETGNKSQVFEEGYMKLLQDGFLDEKYLDEMVSSIDMEGKFKDPNELVLNRFLTTLKANADKLGDNKKIGQELFAKATREYGSMSGNNYDAVVKEFAEAFDLGAGRNCLDLIGEIITP